jgi:hypothetical protein
MAKTRRKRLKQFAILNASVKITFLPEIHDLTQNQLVTIASKTDILQVNLSILFIINGI